jgi:hypothetical protein
MNPISYNTYLKFYRGMFHGQPDAEEKAQTAARKSMADQHKFIRGAQK